MQCFCIRSTMHGPFAEELRGNRQGAALAVLHELGEVQHGVRQLGSVGRRQRLLQRVGELLPRSVVELRPARDERRVEEIPQQLRIVVRESSTRPEKHWNVTTSAAMGTNLSTIIVDLKQIPKIDD